MVIENIGTMKVCSSGELSVNGELTHDSIPVKCYMSSVDV